MERVEEGVELPHCRCNSSDPSTSKRRVSLVSRNRIFLDFPQAFWLRTQKPSSLHCVNIAPILLFVLSLSLNLGNKQKCVIFQQICNAQKNTIHALLSQDLSPRFMHFFVKFSEAKKQNPQMLSVCSEQWANHIASLLTPSDTKGGLESDHRGHFRW